MASQSKLNQMRKELLKDSKVKTVKKRQKRELTEEQKAKLVERLAIARAARGSSEQLSIHESIRDLSDDHPLNAKKVKQWVLHQKDLLLALKDCKDSKDSALRLQYWDTETYIFNLQRYLNDGVYRDHRFGLQKQSKIMHFCAKLAYYPDGTPKRSPGVFYSDIGEVYTNEMATEDHATRAKEIFNKKRLRKNNREHSEES
jgi:hypothetical protein